MAVIIPPIPDTAPAMIGGAGFGALSGTIYAMTGIMIGASVSFQLARRYGRPLIARYLDFGPIRRLDRHAAAMGWSALFVGNLIGVNSGLMSYAAGIANLSFPAFLSATFLGVLPQIMLATVSGAALRQYPMLLIAGLVLLTLAITGLRAVARRYIGRKGRKREAHVL